MTQPLENAKSVTRRHFFNRSGLGLGAMALGSLLPSGLRGDDSKAEKPGPMSPQAPMFPAKAKSVIYLHMAGSPSQLELFEHKPELTKFHGKKCPQEYLDGERFAFIKGVPTMLGSQFKFSQHGESGQWISELLPHFSSVVDDVCVIRSVNTEQFNHAPAQLFVHTGQSRLGFPSLGSWVTYGLGSENQDMPGFVVLVSGGKTPSAGKSIWGSGFLPSVYQGVQCRSTGEPVLYLSNPDGINRKIRREALDAIRELNQIQMKDVGDPETLTRIEQYELTYRMQVAVPDVMDISRESQHVLDLYGANPEYVNPTKGAADPRPLYKGNDPTFANNCLQARRLVEKGVRFVQLFDWGWDHHGSSPGESIDKTLPIKCQQIDRAISGLITDLKQRGLLDSTLIVWGGEFGRTPMMQNNVNTKLKEGFVGRDHHPHAYTMWMAGGGIKPGLAYGSTDEIGYHIAENRVGIRDLQATLLNQLGLDPYQFSVPYQGLDARLIGPTDEGKILRGILS